MGNKLNIKKLMETLDNKKFDCEFGFQLSLARLIENTHENFEVEFERRVYQGSNWRCDLVVKERDNISDNIVCLIELKYNCKNDNENKSSYNSRKTFIDDMIRLSNNYNDNAEKYCIFITDKSAVYGNKRPASGNVAVFNKYFASKNEYWMKSSDNNYYFLIVQIIEADKEEDCLTLETGNGYVKYKVLPDKEANK